MISHLNTSSIITKQNPGYKIPNYVKCFKFLENISRKMCNSQCFTYTNNNTKLHFINDSGCITSFITVHE